MEPINTVLGSLAPEDLDFTLMHEHLLLSDWNLRMADPQFFDQEQAMQMIEEVIADAKAHGVKTLVDVTPINYGRDVLLMQAIAKRTGMQPVCWAVKMSGLEICLKNF